MLISLEDVSKSFGATEIFSGITAKIEDRDRIGLIGVNGAGKSTLLNVITGALETDTGHLDRRSGLRIGYLRQNSGLEKGNTIHQEMRRVFQEELDAQEKMRALAARMEDTSLPEEEREALTKEYASLQSFFEAREGYLIDVKINTILTGMGFSGHSLDKEIDVLSGGEKTRLAMCKLLLEEPDLLILDEPTNHLDFRTLLWLEDYLDGYKGALLIVSHDRYFLDRLVTKVWELEWGRFYSYNGNYTRFVDLKAERVARQQKEYDLQQEEIADLEEFVARNLVRATTSARAKSRRNTLEKMERIEKPLPPPQAMKLRFELDKDPVKDVLTLEDVSLWVEEEQGRRTLAQGLDLQIRRGEKVAIVGPNGVGKTTLFKAIQGHHPCGGQVTWGRNTAPSYFDQDNSSLNPNNTVLEEVHRHFPSVYELTVRTTLGWVGLTGEAAFKRVGQLSGGESARVKFAIMMMKRGNVLLLDEPTNHLDLTSKDVLDKALAQFPGTILMISHDRYLLDRVPDRIVEMSPQGFTSYQGRFSSYMEKANLRPQKPAPAPKQEEDKPQKTTYYRSKEQRKAEAARRAAIARLEKEIAEAEGVIVRLEEEMKQPETMSDFVRLDEICSGLEETRTRLDQMMDDWVELTAQEEE